MGMRRWQLSFTVFVRGLVLGHEAPSCWSAYVSGGASGWEGLPLVPNQLWLHPAQHQYNDNGGFGDLADVDCRMLGFIASRHHCPSRNVGLLQRRGNLLPG